MDSSTVCILSEALFLLPERETILLSLIGLFGDVNEEVFKSAHRITMNSILQVCLFTI